METIADLFYKMECKGYDCVEIHFYIGAIWMIVSWDFKINTERLKQAHIEIDFTNYKKNHYVEAI